MSLKSLFAGLAVAAASTGCVVTTGVIIPDRGYYPRQAPIYVYPEPRRVQPYHPPHHRHDRHERHDHRRRPHHH